jgi:DNA-binding ferritin-like protein (Dps family)
LNKIILIGNGFDLAHGLKTRYKDFIDDFWEKEKEKVIAETRKDSDNFVYTDETITMISPCHPSTLPQEIHNNERGYKWFYKNSESGYGKHINDRLIKLSVTFKNVFIKEITEKTDLEDWVDIEEEYYSALKKCLDDENEERIIKLNKDFLAVQKALEKYLLNQTKEITNASPKIKENLISLLNHPINDGDDILILNFNYTNTECYYIESSSDYFPNRIECIHIHGELRNKDNSIIFGYDDDIDDKFKRIEQQNNNNFLKNVKLLKYLETDNYKRLLNFINREKFQVFIMGLSCGISDRTLLNKIFEDENCISIQVFYHKEEDGTDDYYDKISNISRSFTKRTLMIEKVANKKDSKPLT